MGDEQPDKQKDSADDFKRELRSQANKKAAGWAISSVLGLVVIAAMGWWLYLEPKIRLYITSAAGGIPDGAVVAFAGQCPEEQGWVRYSAHTTVIWPPIP